MRSALRNRLADLKVIIIDEISMVSTNLLYYIHLRLNEIFGTTDIEPFADLTILAVGDFFQLPSVGGIASLCRVQKNLAEFEFLMEAVYV